MLLRYTVQYPLVVEEVGSGLTWNLGTPYPIVISISGCSKMDGSCLIQQTIKKGVLRLNTR